VANLLALEPEVRSRVEQMIAAVRGAGWYVTVTSGYRSVEEQERLYYGPHILPVAVPGCSTHNYGLAVDLVTDYPDQAGLAKAFGLIWAGRVDPVHYDVVGWSRWRSLIHDFVEGC